MEGWQATDDRKGEVDKTEVVNNKGNGAREGRCTKKKPKAEGGESEKRGDQRRPEEEKGKIIFKNFHFNFFLTQPIRLQDIPWSADFWANFLLWKFSLCDWSILITWSISFNLIGWICLSQCKQGKSSIYTVSLNIAYNLLFWTPRDLYPPIWLDELNPPDVNKKRYRISRHSYFIPVTWTVSCYLIGWI